MVANAQQFPTNDVCSDDKPLPFEAVIARRGSSQGERFEPDKNLLRRLGELVIEGSL